MTEVVVGGTFEFLHAGHRKLLERAVELGGHVTVGVTTDRFAESVRGREVAPFGERVEAVEEFLGSLGTDFEVRPIDTPEGDTVEEDYDVLVVSPETEPVAEEINREREERGREPLRVDVVGYVLAEDGAPVSATRIHEGEIDGEGNLI